VIGGKLRKGSWFPELYPPGHRDGARGLPLANAARQSEQTSLSPLADVNAR
jgi:hypothetical protein